MNKQNWFVNGPGLLSASLNVSKKNGAIKLQAKNDSYFPMKSVTVLYVSLIWSLFVGEQKYICTILMISGPYDVG